MMCLRAVAFDLFGTLIGLDDPLFRRHAPRTLGVSPRVWLEAVRRVGLRQAFPTVEALAEALSRACQVADPQRASRQLSEGLFHQLASARLYRGVRATLGFLQRRGYGLAVVSNLSSAHLGLIDHFQLRGFFTLVLASCETGFSKPDARVFRELAKGLGCQPGEILVVGDSEAADGAAARYGFPVALVGKELASAAHVGWLALAGSDPKKFLLSPGSSFSARDGSWEVVSLEPLPDASQGRYNLVAEVKARQRQSLATWYAKRFWVANAAFVDCLARELAEDLSLPVPQGVVLQGFEPILMSSKAPGEPYQGELDADTSFDLGSHLAFAYAFANADIRPRNAFVYQDGNRRRLALIDFEHCFLNLAIPPEKFPEAASPQALTGLTLVQAQALATRQVITARTIVRARNEFFSFRQAPESIKRGLAEGFAHCWRRMQREKERLLGKLERRLLQEPWLPVGTWRFRRFLAPFDVEEMRTRLSQDLDEVLPLFMVES